MKTEKTLEQKIEALPAWVREHIKTLDRERSIAVRELSDFLEKQKPSRIFTEDMIGHSVGELLPGGTVQRNYIQSDKIAVEAHGIRVDIYTNYGDTRDESIIVQWGPPNRSCRDVAMIPLSFQRVRLITREKMS